MGGAINPIAAAYDRALSTADPGDVSVGSTSIRLHDLVNRGAEFDSLYLFGPLLGACHRTIGQPFRLSTMLARSVRPESKPQALHSDVKREVGCVGAVGFIIMIDEFRAENGATRFVPGSHQWANIRCEDLPDPVADYPGQELALGSAGSIVIYDAAIWHGHTSNRTKEPRRSIQGMFIQRDRETDSNRTIHRLPETLNRIGDLAKYLIC
jgi:ectoine hydroxylase-related dioxygenase (phytanoyl-CoA dioxygenase family)